jgi:hypothetical protein
MKKIIFSISILLLSTLVFAFIPKPKNALTKNVRVVKIDGKNIEIPIRGKRI